MECPSCGYNEMVEKTCDEIVSYAGHQEYVQGLHGYFCPMCGDAVWDKESYRRYSNAHDLAISQASDRVQRLRKKLGFTQEELAQAMGVNKRLISYYERGRIGPPILLVQFLEAMKQYPELRSKLKSALAMKFVTQNSCSAPAREKRAVG